MAKKDGETVVSGSEGNLGWTNRVLKAFSLCHDSSTGDLTFTIDGYSSTWARTPCYGYQKIAVLAKVNSGDGNVWTSTIVGLDLDGVAPTPSTILANQTTTKKLLEISDGLFADFCLTGEVAFSWIVDPPDGSRAEMFIGAYEESAVPIPATLWLFGSGLAGLAGLRRKLRT